MENALSPGGSLSLMSPIELQEGVASLSRGAYFKEASLDMTLSILTESAAQMSGIQRVGIWALTDDHEELRCLELYELASSRHSSGGVLKAAQCPRYFQALHRDSCIAADDAYLHSATTELAADYLPRHKITAMLDTPIHIRGELQGVLCLEQVLSRQPWTTAHRLFAHAVANLVTLALVEYEADEARREAQHANERMKAVFDASRDAILLADRKSGLVLDANLQAEKLFGRLRQDMVGRYCQHFQPEKTGEHANSGFCQMLDGQFGSMALAEIQRADGQVLKVEVSTELADLSDGRNLALGIFRPING